jgi:hypothetical protein
MTQERKLPVKENAYKIIVRPVARLAALLMFFGAAIAVGWFIDRNSLDQHQTAILWLTLPVGIVTGGSIGSVLAKASATNGSLQQVLRMPNRLLLWFGILAMAVFILTVILFRGNHVAFPGLFAYVLSDLGLTYAVTMGTTYVGSVFLGLFLVSLLRTNEARKLIQKQDH